MYCLFKSASLASVETPAVGDLFRAVSVANPRGTPGLSFLVLPEPSDCFPLAFLSEAILSTTIMLFFPRSAIVAGGVGALPKSMVPVFAIATRAFAAMISRSWRLSFLGFAEAAAASGACVEFLEGGGGDIILIEGDAEWV